MLLNVISVILIVMSSGLALANFGIKVEQSLQNPEKIRSLETNNMDRDVEKMVHPVCKALRYDKQMMSTCLETSSTTDIDQAHEIRSKRDTEQSKNDETCKLPTNPLMTEDGVYGATRCALRCFDIVDCNVFVYMELEGMCQYLNNSLGFVDDINLCRRRGYHIYRVNSRDITSVGFSRFISGEYRHLVVEITNRRRRGATSNHCFKIMLW